VEAALLSAKLPEIVVVAHDELGIDVCRRLASTGKRVVALWVRGDHTQAVPLIDGVRMVDGDARRARVLQAADVANAETILAITGDDQLNVRVVLAARDMNPNIRVVIRQFNRRLGRKISQALPNAESVNPENYAAATYAAAALNSAAYHALEFPRYSERLVAFCRGTVEQFGCGGRTVDAIAQQFGWRVLAVDGDRFPDAKVVPNRGAVLTVFAPLSSAPIVPATTQPAAAQAPVASTATPRRRRRDRLLDLRHLRFDPMLASLSVFLIALLVGTTIYFHEAIGLSVLDAIYFVISTASTTGYGDITLRNASPAAKIVDIILMVGALATTGVLLAYLTAAITKRSIDFAEGRHPLRGSGHFVVCGFGNVGARVVAYLLHAGRRVAVIDRAPDPALAAEARWRGVHVMTANATSDSAISMARVADAQALLALTDNDSANLEIALSAMDVAPGIPIVMRIREHSVAKSLERHFNLRASYASATLAAPLVTGLALEPGSRGTIDVAGAQCTLVQRRTDEHVRSDDDVVLDTLDGYVLVMRKP
jgi:Trk K+ transport system NAD-binding subunit